MNIFELNLSNSCVEFIIQKALGYCYYIQNDYKTAKSILTPLILNYPQIDGNYISGLADILLMLSESAAAMGNYKDALYSGKLATNIAHRRVEYFQKVTI